MVSLDAVTLKNVGIDGSLCKELNTVEFLCLVGKDFDKLLANDLSLSLGIRYACKFI